MPTIANSRLPKPSGWDEFEDICLSSFKLRWGNPNLTRHGRQGQEQQGVDIYGNDNLQRLVGIQCKNTIGTINTKIVDTEIINAEKFTPSLASLYIATTADSDAALQNYVRTISEVRHRNKRFTVDIVFWGAIEHDISVEVKEVAKHYPQFFGGAVLANPSATQRDRDIETMKGLLRLIDIDSTPDFLAYAPKYIKMKFMEHIDCFYPATKAPLFHFYDKNLERLLSNWLNKWMELGALIRAAPYNYINHSDTLSFYMPGDFCQSKQDNDMFDRIDSAVEEFFPLQNAFCDYVRQNYFEIDLVSTSFAARKFHAQI
jgi:hypothetical protein